MDELLGGLRDEGVVDSTGAFTVDWEHAREKLARFQLTDPASYVLRFVAAAVAGGAQRLTVGPSLKGVKIEWDGASLDLAGWLDALVRGTPVALAELACGLNSARLLYSTITLKSGEHSLSWKKDRVTLEPGPPCAGVSVVLSGRRKSLWQELTRSNAEVICLRKRGSLAPLALGLAPSWPREKLYLVQVGEPPHKPRLVPDLVLPETPHGGGFLLVDGQLSSHATIVHLGVSFQLSLQLPAAVTWWTSSLPLNLSRSALVAGPELDDWKTFVHATLGRAVQKVLVGRRGSPSLVDWAVRWKLPAVETLPIFSRADGSRATLVELREQVRQTGYLGVVKGAGPREFLALEPELVEALRHTFACVVEVSSQGARLPADRSYLVRVPTTGGEMGLTADEVVLAGPDRQPDLFALHSALREVHLPPELEGVRGSLLLKFLESLAQEDETPRLLRMVTNERISRLVGATRIDAGGGFLSLSGLLERRGPLLSCALRQGDPRELVQPSDGERIHWLLSPLVSVQQVRPLTGALREMLAGLPRPLSTLAMLRALAPLLGLPSPSGDDDQGDALLRFCSLRYGLRKRLGRFDMLAGMLEFPCPAGEALVGYERAGLEAPDLAVSEQLADVDSELLLVCERGELFVERAYLRLLCRRTDLARADLERALGRCTPGSRVPESLRPAEYERVLLDLELYSGPDCQLARAAVSKSASLAQEVVDEFPESGAALALLARLTGSLDLCSRALEKPDCPGTIWETRASLLFGLGRADEARESLRRFLSVWTWTILDPDLEERRTRARALL